MASTDRSKNLFVAASFLALAVYPWIGGKFGVDLVTKIMIYAIFALSLELLVGGTGLVCFGQAAFFGIGAYGVAVSSAHWGASWGSLVAGVTLALLLSLVLSLAIGLFSLRVKAIFYAMITLAVASSWVAAEVTVSSTRDRS